jgi:hypothetical protein
MAGMEQNARQNPDKQFDVLQALEEGDLVAVHSHVRQKPGDRGAVVFHLFPIRRRSHRRTLGHRATRASRVGQHERDVLRPRAR